MKLSNLSALDLLKVVPLGSYVRTSVNFIKMISRTNGMLRIVANQLDEGHTS